MLCMKCGKGLEGSGVYCPNCAPAVEQATNDQAAKAKVYRRRKPISERLIKVYAVAVAAFSILLTVALFPDTPEAMSINGRQLIVGEPEKNHQIVYNLGNQIRLRGVVLGSDESIHHGKYGIERMLTFVENRKFKETQRTRHKLKGCAAKNPYLQHAQHIALIPRGDEVFKKLDSMSFSKFDKVNIVGQELTFVSGKIGEVRHRWRASDKIILLDRIEIIN